MKWIKQAFVMAIGLALVCPLPAFSQSSYDEDAKVISNTMRYIRGMDVSTAVTRLGIVYDPEQIAAGETQRILEAFRQSAEAKRAGIEPVLIPIDQLAKAAPVSVLYIVGVINDNYAAIRDFTTERRIFAIGHARPCAEAYACILSVETAPRIQIFLNESRLKAQGFEVNSAFRFMVKQI